MKIARTPNQLSPICTIADLSCSIDAVPVGWSCTTRVPFSHRRAFISSDSRCPSCTAASYHYPVAATSVSVSCLYPHGRQIRLGPAPSARRCCRQSSIGRERLSRLGPAGGTHGAQPGQSSGDPGHSAVSPDGIRPASRATNAWWAFSPRPRCSSRSTVARSARSIASSAKRSPGKASLWITPSASG